MAAILESVASTEGLSDDLAELARKVRASVVAVRGTASGGGAGVVWDRRGIVITNHHVAPGQRAEIDLGDGECLPARVIGQSRQLDLAVLRIDQEVTPGLLAPATIGDSSRLQVGELVVAVGNPLGERNAVTLGLVSGHGKVNWPDGSRDVIQVGITLRPGNSGGALANTRGQVVGIPHMVVGAGQALAIPSNTVTQFLRGILGSVTAN